MSPRIGLLLLFAGLLTAGCTPSATFIPESQRKVIDRSVTEYPPGFELCTVVRNLTAPTAIAFDNEGSLIVAEGGDTDREPAIFGFKPSGERFNIYPVGRRIPFNPVRTGFRIYGPIGGMTVVQGRIYVTHRDANWRGAITAFGYDGSHSTIVADLPAQGDYSVTDIAVHPNGRLWFGLGAATNSGVVGLDNWESGWVRYYPDFCDSPFVDLILRGQRFDTPNPRVGLGVADVAVSGPFQRFGVSNRIRIARSAKPTAAIYSVSLGGGDLRVEAWGVRMPRGLAFNEYQNLYMTDNGMEMRGTRPVKDDPDTLLRVVPGTWYGWPDFSADLQPIHLARFQPPEERIIKTGYPYLSYLIDHEATGLIRPDSRTLVRSIFPSLSGAAKLDFVPASGPFKEFRSDAVVALYGDRSPFASGKLPLKGPIGFKVVRIDVTHGQMRDFVYNTEPGPASQHPEARDATDALERPYDVKFGPDGSMYIVDLGFMEMKNGREKFREGTGKILKLTGAVDPATSG